MRTVAIFAIALLTGCSGHSDTGFQRQQLATAIQSQATIKLADYTSFTWDRFYVFEPYATDEQVRKEVGHPVAFPNSLSEGHCLLVFVHEGKVERSFEERRIPVDFSGISRSNGYTPDEAVFTGVNAGDRYVLKAAN